MKKTFLKENSRYEVNSFHEVFYIESLLSITRTALSEKNVIVTILEDFEKGNHQNHEILIDAAQNLINCTASLSKFFWPISKESKKRGQVLRNALKIKESNVIKNRNVRNFIEHFDEKLDFFLSELPTGLIIPIYVGPRVNEETKKLFRAYFTDEAVFKILDLEYKIIPIISEIEIIHNLLNEKVKTGRF